MQSYFEMHGFVIELAEQSLDFGGRDINAVLYLEVLKKQKTKKHL